MVAIETEEYKGYRIETYPDECYIEESPREWDNLSIWHCWHKRMELGDENYNLYRQADVDDLNKTLRTAKRNNDVVIKLYIYQHGGIVLSLSSFAGKLPQGHAEFDSGQVGFVIIRRKKILEEYGGKKLTAKLRARAIKVAEGEVKTFNQYACGDVSGYKIFDTEGGVVDSCWGFYGSENVATTFALKEARAVVDNIVAQKEKEKQPV